MRRPASSPLPLSRPASDGVVVAGTTGESPTLTPEEQTRLFAEIKEALDGAGDVVAGTGSNSTAEAVKYTADATKVGADAVLSVVPYYNKPPQEGLYRHFKAVAEEHRPSGHPLQRDQPHRHQHVGRHRHPPERDPQHRGHQGGRR